MVTPRKAIKTVLRSVLRLLPLDGLLFLSQRLCDVIAWTLYYRDWALEAYGRPQFFKHEINLSRWRFDPQRWSFAARGVYARERMFRGCSVLDLCCGDGSNAYLFFSDIAGHIDAVDNDDTSLAYARRYHAATTITYHKINIVTHSLPTRGYDIVVWNAAICYFTEMEIRLILEKIVRVGSENMEFCGMLPIASGYSDHKTEFPDLASVEALLKSFFSIVTVLEVDEISTRTFYFRALKPTPLSLPFGSRSRAVADSFEAVDRFFHS